MQNIIDAHIHFWTKRHSYDDVNDISGTFPPEGPLSEKDFQIEDYLTDVKTLQSEFNVNTKGFVYVQVYHSTKETERVCELAKNNEIIRGIVGWADLQSDRINEDLKRLKEISINRLVGIRHLVQYEEKDWLWQPSVQRSLQALQDNRLCFDIDGFDKNGHLSNLIQLPELARKFPKLNFIVNHMSLHHSNRSNVCFDQWKKGISKAAECPNVFCKLSGTIANKEELNDQVRIFDDYYRHVLDSFGVDRCLYASDWSVFKLNGNCDISDQFRLTDIQIRKYFKNDIKECLNKIYYENVIRIYGLKV